jgi:hypothetical protein
MKNQYFGDVNDFRKYGLLRGLIGNSEIRVGVCWMLTPNDHRPDGEKTKYLEECNRHRFRHFDPKLYDFLHRNIRGHETNEQARNIQNFGKTQLSNGQFWEDLLVDSAEKRQQYFNRMWHFFTNNGVNLVFFDPDDGLANNNSSKSPLKKGRKGSSKKLFRDEIQTSLAKGLSVLFYQHFDRTPRSEFIERLGVDFSKMSDSNCAYSFWTPHVVFF